MNSEEHLRFSGQPKYLIISQKCSRSWSYCLIFLRTFLRYRDFNRNVTDLDQNIWDSWISVESLRCRLISQKCPSKSKTLQHFGRYLDEILNTSKLNFLVKILKEVGLWLLCSEFDPNLWRYRPKCLEVRPKCLILTEIFNISM